jgi:mono/diheme cytochrome c family protein
MVKSTTIIMGLFLMIACVNAAPNPATPSPEKQVARGKYLVERVALCQDCHTPRTEKGEFDRAQWLGGTTLFFQAIKPIPGWREASPPIAGLEGWSTEEAIKFLQTGISRDGKPADPPMPPYRLNQSDAAAVVAYLKSLKK